MKQSNIEVEKFLQKIIFPELEKGRPNWDKPHTIAVVQKLKEIIQNSPKLEIDSVVLLIAAYAHDWGYANLFSNGKPVNYDIVAQAKPLHMEIGADKINTLLGNNFFSFLSHKQKKQVVHLVKIHDQLDSLKDVDELILLEADTLGAMDVDLVKPTYDKKSNEKYLLELTTKRLPKFITKYGKQEALELITKRIKYYQSSF